MAAAVWGKSHSTWGAAAGQPRLAGPHTQQGRLCSAAQPLAHPCGPSCGARPSPGPCPSPGPPCPLQACPVGPGPSLAPCPPRLPLPTSRPLPGPCPPPGPSCGPGAVLAKPLLALCRAELPQLLPLQLVGGETGQEFKEGAAGDTGNVQVLGHEAPHGAGLGQLRGAGDACRGWDTVGAARGPGTGAGETYSASAAARGLTRLPGAAV